MKDSAEYAPRLKKLLNRLKRQGVPKVKDSMIDPTSALVLGCLSSVTTETKARSAFNKLANNYVDFNELRVSRVEEVTEVLGREFPQAKEISSKITRLLKQIYSELDSLDMSDMCNGSKREAKAFLQRLEDATPYVVSRVMLQSVQAHAFPVHEQMLKMLRKEEVVSAEAKEADVQGFLERQISANKIQKTYALLRRHSDNYRPRAGDAKKRPKKKIKKAKEKAAKKV